MRFCGEAVEPAAGATRPLGTMEANMPLQGPALLTVGTMAVLLQVWLTSSPIARPGDQVDIPRKPVHDDAPSAQNEASRDKAVPDPYRVNSWAGEESEHIDAQEIDPSTRWSPPTRQGPPSQGEPAEIEELEPGVLTSLYESLEHRPVVLDAAALESLMQLAGEQSSEQ